MTQKYILHQSTSDPRWWVVTDTENGIVCRFEQHRFNTTQHYTLLDDLKRPNPNNLARIANGIADWLAVNHYDLAMGEADTMEPAETSGAKGIQMGAYIFPRTSLRPLIDRARETVKAWVTDNWHRVIGTPEEILENLIQYDDEFYELWQVWCDEHGWDEDVDMQHPDTQALLSAICDMQELTADIPPRYLVGKAIGGAMKEQGMTIKRLSELTGYNPSNISRIINGKYAASIDIIGKIAHALGRRIDFIDEGDE